jgi:O-antigen ligase
MFLKSRWASKNGDPGKSNLHHLLWWLAAGVAATIIWLPIVNAVLCIGFFAAWLFASHLRLKVLNNSQFLLLSSVYLITAISFFYSGNVSQAVQILQLKLPLLIFPFAFASGIVWKKVQVKLLLLLFSWSVVVFCLCTIGNAMVQAFSAAATKALFGYNIIPFKFVYAAVASLFCVFAAVIHLHEMNVEKKLSLKHLLPLLIFWITLILLSNRMGLLLISIATIFYLLRMVNSVSGKVIVITFIFVCAAGLYTFNKNFRAKVEAIGQFASGQKIQLDTDASLGRTWDGLQIRVAIWNCAAGIIKKHFWTGVGVGDVQQTLQKTYEERKFYFASRYNSYNAHNQFIEQWLMTGVAGAVLFLLSLVIPLWQSLRSGHMLYSVFLIVFICFSLTESFLEVSKGVVWFSFFNSIFAFQQCKKDT